ncbi:hypothetical protein [Rhizobium sp. Root483D2]|uniref:hypothetical protein n=1 Tax=Rhizobium sp. Root483D2 TaxID=1736545 RepID=UPI001FCD39F0|nr:hypothetical protein [Rhizobium sp. Root483D2]
MPVLQFKKALGDLAGWNKASFDIYPVYQATIIRIAEDGQREIAQATWGMPSTPAFVKNYGRHRVFDHFAKRDLLSPPSGGHLRRKNGAPHDDNQLRSTPSILLAEIGYSSRAVTSATMATQTPRLISKRSIRWIAPAN